MSIRQVLVSSLRKAGDIPGVQTFRQFTITGTSGTPPLSPPCGDTTIAGFRISPGVGTCSPSTFRGYTINTLDQETTYVDDGFGSCVVNTCQVYFQLAGFAGASTFIDKIVCVDNANYTFNRSSATYGGGLWTWDDSIDFGFLTGTIRVYYTP